jgi:DNA-binding MurR/RpiR family transcriptional regulator
VPVDVPAVIRSHLDRLSPNDRLIASWLLEHHDEASLETADSLARKVGVSKAAVVRFGAKLGFGGYAGLHEAISESARTRLAAPGAAREGAGGHVLDRWLDACVRDLEATRRALDPQQFEEIARLLRSQTGRTYIFGQRKSAALAEYAFFLLTPQVRNVQLIEAGPASVADLLLDVGPDDRLLAFTFRRYVKLAFDVVAYFAQAGATTVLVTDDSMIPPAAQAAHVLVCTPASPGPFASAIGGMYVIEALAACVAKAADRGDHRLDTAEELWDRFGLY